MATWRRKVRVVQQMEAAECGVACLCMLLDYHGQSRTLEETRELCGSSRDGTSALELLEAAQRAGLVGHGVSVSLGDLELLNRPAILHWAFNHFVILERHGRSAVTIVDPATGRRRVPMSEVSRLFSGVALDLAPGPAFEKRKRTSLGFSRYVKAVRGQRGALAFVVLANITQQVLAVGMPAASQFLIDHVIQPSRETWLAPVLLVLAVAAVAQIILQRLQGLSQSILHVSLSMVLTREMGERLLQLPLPFLESRSHGDLLERVNMQSELQDLLAQTVQAIFDILFVGLLIGLMLAYDPFLGGVSLALTTLRVFIMRWVRRPITQRVAAELGARGREAGSLVESTFSIEMTKGLGLEKRLEARYAERVRERMHWGIQSARLEAGLARAMTVLGASMHAIILWFGGLQVIGGEMSIGVFAGFLAIRTLVAKPMASVLSLAERWIRVRGVLERCEDVLSAAPVRETGTAKTADVGGHIELINLGFRFGKGSPWVLRNVNLTIQPGQHVAVVGASGQGKSTLAKLVCGLLEPTEGRVLLDGRDIAEYDREELARSFGVVLQQPLVMEGPVRDALAIRKPESSTGELVLAAQLACFDDVVQKLPNGYDSRLQALGANLSGGERQRLAIAQALLGGPRVLLMDEGTCSLDPALERRVLHNIARSRGTLLSVAHRSSVVEHAERVVVVHEGRVSEVSGASRAIPGVGVGEYGFAQGSPWA